MATKKAVKKVVKKRVPKKKVSEIVASHQQEVAKSLQKHGLIAQLLVHFPAHKKVPVLGRLGIWLVNKYGGIIDTRYTKVDGTLTSNSKKRRR